MLYKHYLNKSVKTTVQPKNKVELKKIIEDTIKEQGFNCDLNFIDTSLIKDMSSLFSESNFNGDISKWDVSNVKNTSVVFDEYPLEGNEPDWSL